jgi:WD40 repeat protein
VRNGGTRDRGLVFSADGSRILLVEGWNTHVLDAESGRVIHRLAHDNDVNSAAFASNGRTVVTALQFSASWKIWDLESGSPRGTLDSGCRRLVSDGRSDIVWSLCDNVPTAWNVATRQRTGSIEGRRHKDLAVTPDGSRVVTLEGFADVTPSVPASPRVLRVYDASTLRELQEIDADKSVGQALLGCIDDGTRWVIETNDGVSLVDLTTRRITSLCDDTNEAAGGGDVVVVAQGSCNPPTRTLRMWRSGELLHP